MTNLKTKLKFVIGASWVLSVFVLSLPSLPIADWMANCGIAEAHISLYTSRIEPALLGLTGLSFSSTFLYVIFNILKSKKIIKTDIIQEVTSTTTLNSEKTIMLLMESFLKGLEHLSQQVADVAQNRITSFEQTPLKFNIGSLIEEATNQIERVSLQVRHASRTLADKVKEATLHIEAAKMELKKASTPHATIAAQNTISYWENVLAEIKKGF